MKNVLTFPLHLNSASHRSYTRVGRYKRGQGSCSFNCCDEEGISPGAVCIQMTPAEISFSMQLLKIKEPCPPFQMVSLFMHPLVKFPLHHNSESCRSPALEGRAPAALTVVMKMEFHQVLHIYK